MTPPNGALPEQAPNQPPAGDPSAALAGPGTSAPLAPPLPPVPTRSAALARAARARRLWKLQGDAFAHLLKIEDLILSRAGGPSDKHTQALRRLRDRVRRRCRRIESLLARNGV